MKYFIAFILLVFLLLVFYIMYSNKEGFANNEDPYIIDIATGGNHSVFINKYGKCFICGKNDNGKLGTGNNVSIILPILIQNITNIEKVYAGNANTFFLTKEGAVYSCGENSKGQLGIGNLYNQFVPILIPFFKDIPIRKIAAGWYHTIFLAMSGDVYVSGDNIYGQLANGTNISTNIPIKLDLKCSDIAAGLGHSVFLTTDQNVYTSGWNCYGQLGNSITPNSNIPVLVIQMGPNNPSLFITKVYAGMQHTLFLNNDGKVYVCGDNTNGQIALEKNITTQRSFILLNNLPSDDKIIDVSAGQRHTLFLTSKGNVYSVGLTEVEQELLAKNKKARRDLVAKITKDIELLGNNKKHQRDLVSKITKYQEVLGKKKKGKRAIVAKIKKHQQHLAKIKKKTQVFKDNIKKGQKVFSLEKPVLDFYIPKKILFNNNEISKIATGSNHSLFLTKKGFVYASGDNNMGGQLGIRNITYTREPKLCDIEIEIEKKDTNTFQQDISGQSNN